LQDEADRDKDEDEDFEMGGSVITFSVEGKVIEWTYDELAYVISEWERRKEEGKESEFFYNGTRIPTSVIERFAKLANKYAGLK
jgi:hypothetical protein